MMFLFSWWRRRVRSKPAKRVAQLFQRRLAFERLENRCLLSSRALPTLFITDSPSRMDDRSPASLAIVNLRPPATDPAAPIPADGAPATGALATPAAAEMKIIYTDPGSTVAGGNAGDFPTPPPALVRADSSSTVPDAEASTAPTPDASALVSDSGTSADPPTTTDGSAGGDATGDPQPIAPVADIGAPNRSAPGAALLSRIGFANASGQAGDSSGDSSPPAGTDGTQDQTGNNAGQGDQPGPNGGDNSTTADSPQATNGTGADGSSQVSPFRPLALWQRAAGTSGRQGDTGDGQGSGGDNGQTGTNGSSGDDQSSSSGDQTGDGTGSGDDGNASGDQGDGGSAGSSTDSGGGTGSPEGDSGNTGALASDAGPSADGGTTGNHGQPDAAPTNPAPGRLQDQGALPDLLRKEIQRVQKNLTPPAGQPVPDGSASNLDGVVGNSDGTEPPPAFDFATDPAAWDTAEASVPVATPAAPLDGRDEMLVCGRGPRQGTAGGHLDNCEGTATETTAPRPTLPPAPAAAPEAESKPLAHVASVLGNPTPEGDRAGKPEDHEAHSFAHAAVPVKWHGPRGRAPFGHPANRSSLGSGHEGAGGPAGRPERTAALSALPPTAELDPQALAGGSALFPFGPMNAQAEAAAKPTDRAGDGGLAPQFVGAPFFPKRPQPTLMLAIADEPTLDAFNIALTQAGYVVFTASTVHDALGLLKTPALSMDAAIVDVNLPDASGLHLVGKVRELFPWLPVMLFADPAQGVDWTQLRQTDVPVLWKSSAPGTLLAQVRALVS